MRLVVPFHWARRWLWALASGLIALGAVIPTWAAGNSTPPLYALIVGGGPNQDNNAAQIEGHAQFVGRILPPGTRRIVLFADGKTDGAKICYVDKSPEAMARQAL